ncbi:MAG: V-type ATP synthase subunit F [Candidatus Hydrogenedentes bacterium]|nr:V-type ATP synthase subunit F [Candidatus Hydrogenedentota bacterium]
MRLHIIGDPESVLGFRLAGINGTVAADRASALEALKSVLDRRDTGILFITEGVAAQVRETVERHLYGTGFPLLLEIPDASGPRADRPPIEDVVRRAVGIQL